MFVCLKYWLQVLSESLTNPSMIQDDLRKNFGKIRRGGHDKRLVVARPGYQTLYTLIFQHTKTGQLTAALGFHSTRTCRVCE